MDPVFGEHFTNYNLEWFVDVQDDAQLHVAALTNPKVQNERIYAYAEPFTVKYVQFSVVYCNNYN